MKGNQACKGRTEGNCEPGESLHEAQGPGQAAAGGGLAEQRERHDGQRPGREHRGDGKRDGLVLLHGVEPTRGRANLGAVTH